MDIYGHSTRKTFEHITYNVNFSPRKLWADLLKERETTSQAMENTNYIETKKDIEDYVLCGKFNTSMIITKAVNSH